LISRDDNFALRRDETEPAFAGSGAAGALTCRERNRRISPMPLRNDARLLECGTPIRPRVLAIAAPHLSPFLTSNRIALLWACAGPAGTRSHFVILRNLGITAPDRIGRTRTIVRQRPYGETVTDTALVDELERLASAAAMEDYSTQSALHSNFKVIFLHTCFGPNSLNRAGAVAFLRTKLYGGCVRETTKMSVKCWAPWRAGCAKRRRTLWVLG